MESIDNFLRGQLQMERNGGRIKHSGCNTVEVWDVSTWGEAQTEKLKQYFPWSSVRYAANSNSLSGFVVIIEQKWRGQVTSWFTIYFSVMACLVAMVHYVSSYTSVGILQ